MEFVALLRILPSLAVERIRHFAYPSTKQLAAYRQAHMQGNRHHIAFMMLQRGARKRCQCGVCKFLYRKKSAQIRMLSR